MKHPAEVRCIKGASGNLSDVFIKSTFLRYKSFLFNCKMNTQVLLLSGLINEILSMDTPIWLQAIIGSCIVTTGEFISGCILNLWLGLGIWDYSNMPFNLLGQICLPFSLLWVILSACAIVIDDYERYWFFGEEKPYYRWKFKEKK